MRVEDRPLQIVPSLAVNNCARVLRSPAVSSHMARMMTPPSPLAVIGIVETDDLHCYPKCEQLSIYVPTKEIPLNPERETCVLILPLSPDGSAPPELVERLKTADLNAKLCGDCRDEAEVECSPECCHACADLRVRAVLAALGAKP